MNCTNFRSHLRLASAIAVVAIAAPAVGQDQVSDDQADVSSSEGSDVIIVTGFKKSLEDALNLKRSGSGISDSISSEDIGKSTDQNIAEALQRVTGVAIAREDGEGTTVTVRGAGPDLNNVTLNGVPVTSSGASNAVDFSEYSADLLNSITVYKTAQANQNEGSLGGTIELKTVRPLSVKKDRLVLDAQARYNEFLNPGKVKLFEPDDYRLNASFVKKLFNDTVGVSVVATKETSSLRKDVYQNTWYLTQTFASATNLETGQPGYLNYDANGDGTLDSVAGRMNRQVNYQHFTNSRDRNSINGTVQWQPTDNTELILNATWSTQNIASSKHEFATTGPTATINGTPTGSSIIIDPSTDTFVQNIFQQRFSATAFPGNDNAPRSPGVIRVFQQDFETTSDNLVFSGEFNQQLGNLKVSLKGGRSVSKSLDDNYLQGRASVPTTNNLSVNLFDANGIPRAATAAENTAGLAEFYKNGFTCVPDVRICQLVINSQVPDNGNYFAPNIITQRTRSFRDEVTAGYLDLEWETDFGPITLIRAGAKYEDRAKDNNSSSSDCNNACLGGDFTDFRLGNYVVGTTPSDFGERLGLPRDSLSDGWFIWDLQSQLEDALASAGIELPAPTIDLAGTRSIDQKVYGGYMMADFDFSNLNITGNIGVRYARTEVVGQGYAGLRWNAIDFDTGANRTFYGQNATTGTIRTTNLLGPLTFNNDGSGRVSLGNNNVDSVKVPLTDTYKYENWLPSFNATWAAKNNLLVRFAASQTIARPPIDLLRPNFSVVEQYTNPESLGTQGNTRLNPFKSRNLDLSVEWYFRPDSLFSVALFDKKISDFIEETNTLYYWRDLRSTFFQQAVSVGPLRNPNGTPLLNSQNSFNGVLIPAGQPIPGAFVLKPADQINFEITPDNVLLPATAGTTPPTCHPERANPVGSRQPVLPGQLACDQVNLEQARNASGGYVRGVEVTFQHNFSWLPGLLSGFGIAANYTYSDSKSDAETAIVGGQEITYPAYPLVGTSKHTINGTMFWEKDGKLIRLAYNKRTDYLVDRGVRDGGAHWIEGFDTLDLSASWRFSKYFTLYFQGQNLLDTVTRIYSTTVQDPILGGEESAFDGATKNRTAELSNTGRIYRIGARFTF